MTETLEKVKNERLFRVKRGFFIMAALFLAAGASCVSTQKPPATDARLLSFSKPPILTLAPKPILSQRIHFLETYLRQEGISPDSGKAAEKVLRTYRSLLSASSDSLTLKDRERLIQSLFGSLLKVEAMYFDSHTRKAQSAPQKSDIYIGEYKVPPQKQNAEGDAKTRYRDDSSVEMSSQAEKKRMPTFQQEVLRAREIPESETTPDLNVLLGEVNTFVGNREYEKAIHLLLEAEMRADATPAKEIIIKAKQYVSDTRKAKAGPLKIDQQDEGKIGEKTKDLLEQEKYEAAINRLDTVESALDHKAEKELARLKEDAVNGLINRERNRAAKFFLKSKRTKDPEEKREALYISRDILADLVLSYPNSSQVHKVKQNLEVVRRALEQLE